MKTVTTVVTIKVRCDSYHDLGYYPECHRNWQVEGDSQSSCIKQLCELGWNVNAASNQTLCPDCMKKWVEKRTEILDWEQFQEREPEKADALEREYHGLEEGYGDLWFAQQERPDLPWRAFYLNNQPYSPWYWRESDKRWVC